MHIPAPDDLRDSLLACGLGEQIRAFNLKTGDVFTYSQALSSDVMDDATRWAWSPCHPMRTEPDDRGSPNPRLARDMWVANLHHILGPPTLGRVTAVVCRAAGSAFSTIWQDARTTPWGERKAADGAA